MPDISANKEFATIMIEQLKEEKNIEISKKIIKILSVLARHPFIDASLIMESLFDRLLNKSKGLESDIIDAIKIIHSCKPIFTDKILHIIDTKLMYISSVKTRISYLELFITLFGSSHNNTDSEIYQETFCCYLKDSDARVRKTALICLQMLHYKKDSNKPFVLSNNLYQEVLSCLTDIFEDVRYEAVRLIWILSNCYPEYADDGFIKICGMVSDISVKVRTLSCALLGTVQNVSKPLLLQSLNKNSIKASSLNKQDQSTNPDTSLSKLTIKGLIESNAYGAFVHGLEDEYFEVRTSAINSICEISKRTPRFGRDAVELIVDMFNDEIEIVRINSLYSLSKFGSVLKLTEDHLQTVLSIFHDVSLNVRIAVHTLLRSTILQNIKCFKLAIHGLLADSKRHRVDRDHTLETLKEIGHNHPHFVELDIEELLSIDPKFLPRENRIDDFNYIGLLTVVFNAAKSNPNIISHLPKHISKHYLFLIDKYPQFIPRLPKLLPCEDEI